MNKHGGTLILFIILIPIIIIFMAFVVDLGLTRSRKIKLMETTKEIIKDNFDKEDTQIIEIFKKNGIQANIKRDDNKLNIKIEEDIKSIFGSIIGIKSYKIRVNITGFKNQEKINFEVE